MLKSFYQGIFITTLSLFISLSCTAQTDLDKSKIYNAVLEPITDKTTPILDQTLASINNFDIDNSYNQYNFEKGRYQKEDYKPTKIRFVCVVPLMHYRSLSISGYLQSKNILADISKLFEQVRNIKIDSLSKYVSSNMLKSKQGIFGRGMGKLNLRYVKPCVMLSAVLFDTVNNIAFIKYEVIPKENVSNNYTDKIIVLNKVGDQWIIKDTLE